MDPNVKIRFRDFQLFLFHIDYACVLKFFICAHDIDLKLQKKFLCLDT